MQKNKVKHIAIFVFNAIFFCIAAQLLPIMFEDNDDITMAWIASGIYSGIPDYHLVFINAIWGKLLNLLYTLIPTVEWYSIGFAVLQIISMTVIFNFWNETTIENDRKIYINLLFYLFWLLIIVRLQFTTTAAITAFAGTILLYRKKFISGGLFLILGSLIRFSAAGLVGLLMAPALICSYKLDIKKAYLPLFFILISVFCIHKADSFFYNTRQWKYYSEFNEIRGKINDNPNLWRAVGHLPANISENEFATVAAFAIDPTLTTTDDLISIFESFNNTPLYKKAKNIYPHLIKRYWKWFIAILLLLIIPAIKVKKDNYLIFALFIYLFWFCILSCVCLNGSVKFRVYLSSILPIIYYCGIFVYKQKDNGNKLLWYILSSSILIYLIGNTIFDQHNSILKKQEEFAEQIELVEKANDMIIISRGADYMVEMYPPFKLSKSVKTCSFINPYCMMASPLNHKYKSYKDAIDSNLCYLSRKEAGFDVYIKTLLESYNIIADTTHIADTQNFSLIKISTVSNEQFP